MNLIRFNMWRSSLVRSPDAAYKVAPVLTGGLNHDSLFISDDLRNIFGGWSLC